MSTRRMEISMTTTTRRTWNHPATNKVRLEVVLVLVLTTTTTTMRRHGEREEKSSKNGREVLETE